MVKYKNFFSFLITALMFSGIFILASGFEAEAANHKEYYNSYNYQSLNNNYDITNNALDCRTLTGSNNSNSYNNSHYLPSNVKIKSAHNYYNDYNNCDVTSYNIPNQNPPHSGNSDNTIYYTQRSGKLYPAQKQNRTPSVPADNPPQDTTNNNAQVSDVSSEEQQMVNLVNQARTQAGLNALAVNKNLVNAARIKSQDMIDNNYFSHTSPTFGATFDLMKSLDFSYGYAGENLAGNQSVSAAHTSLMNSSGHRANILSTNFKQIGIGIVHGGSYGIMFTQLFTD